MSHKRSNSELGDLDSKPAKTARVEDASRPDNALASAKIRIGDLENQIQELHAFLNANGMTRRATRIFAAQSKTQAAKVSDKLFDQCHSTRQTSVTSDDISKAMAPFLREVEDVRTHPESTAIAFDLVMTIGGYSYGDLDSDGGGYGDRPSDEKIDNLLSELAPERRRIEPL